MNTKLLQSKAVLLPAMVALAVVFGLAGTVVGWKGFVAASAGLAGAFVLVRYASALWILLVALLAFSVEIRIPGTGAEVVVPTEGLIPALAVVALAKVFLRGKFRWTASRLNAPVALFVLAMAATLLASGDRGVTLKAVVRDFSYLVAGFFLIRSFLTTRARLRALLLARLVVTVTIVAYGLYTQFTEGIRIYQLIARPFFREYSVYAALLAMDFAVLSAFVLEYPRSGLRWIGIGVLGFWGFALAMTFSRGAWLSVFALVAFYACLERRQIDLKVFIAVIMVLVLGVGIVGSLQVSELFSQRMEHLTDIRFLTNYDRIDRWMAALSMFSEHPLLGVGWGRYADEYYRYIFYIDAYSTDIRMGAHNLYLEMLAESGLVGLGSFLILLALFATEAQRLRRRTTDRFYRAVLTGAMGALLTYLVHAFVNNLGPSDKIGITFWVLIGLAPVVGRLMEQPQPPQTRGSD